MRIHYSTDPQPTSATEKLHVYNALDCCITLEVVEQIEPQLDEVTQKVYDFAMDLQGPILDMECRGVRVDKSKISKVRGELMQQIAYLEEGLHEICVEGLGIPPINPRSPPQMKKLLYETLGLPVVKKRSSNGSYEPTADRKALEKLRSYFFAEPIINHVLGIRDLGKKLGVLNTGLDPDGRMRTSYNIGGTDTGRLSSYESAFGSGTNLQNITEELREIFVADPGKKMAYIDLQQVQSRNVGAICWNLFHDGKYLDFCESGDLHTGVCMMTWKSKPWLGEGLEALTNKEFYKHNRRLADEQFYRVDSFRQGSKKLGHATNFLGKPQEISQQTRIPKDLIEEFQRSYFRAFPSIPEWHGWLRQKLLRDGFITTITGRRRHFFGRRWDDETVRAAAAYEPQDMEARINQKGALQLWKAQLPTVELLIPVHDAILIQYDEEREDELIPQILEVLKVPIPLMHGREFLVPHDVAVGWNWKYARDDKGKVINPDGLEKYKGHDARSRSAPASILDRRFHSTN